MQWDDKIIGLMLAATGFLFVLSILLVLRFAAGVAWNLDFDPGPPLRKSWWGSGSVNGIPTSWGLQVVEYQKGWVVRMLPTWFFGVLWFPKDQAVVGKLEWAIWIPPQRRLLEIGADTVVLKGHLAAFVTSEAAPREGSGL
jgi:hypothetical protein